MQLSQPGEEGQAAVLYVTNMVEAKAQPGKSEEKKERREVGQCTVH